MFDIQCYNNKVEVCLLIFSVLYLNFIILPPSANLPKVQWCFSIASKVASGAIHNKCYGFWTY